MGLATLHHVDRLGWAGGAVFVGFVVAWSLRRVIGRLSQRRPEESRELRRLRTWETGLVLLATAIPYGVVIFALAAIVSMFTPQKTAAVAGASLFVVVVGFGAQRFLQDVIAGVLIAVERWYAIGDFVLLEPMKTGGIVEAFGLRTTVVRSLNGDRMFVPNSQIQAAVRSPRNFRRYSIELLTHDVEQTRNAVATVERRGLYGEARFLRPPRVVDVVELGDDLWLARVQADVPPTMEWLAESWLPARIVSAHGEGVLAADPIVYTLDESTLSRYERRVLVS